MCDVTGVKARRGSTSLFVQGSAKRLRPGLVNFVTAVAYHLCLALPAGFTQPGRSLFADPCRNSLLRSEKKEEMGREPNQHEKSVDLKGSGKLRRRIVRGEREIDRRRERSENIPHVEFAYFP